MGMYSSLEGTNVPSSQNGLPNVSQFGWTSYEMEEYKQLIEYVDEAKQYSEQTKILYEFILTLQGALEAIKAEIDGIKIDIDTRHEDIKAMHSGIGNWFDQIKIWQQEVKDNTLIVSDALGKITNMLEEIKILRNNVEALKNQAEVSATSSATSAAESLTSANKSEEMFNKCYELYEALRKGQVYRGIWNPHSGAYPDPQGTNSVWDVVLNENEEEFEFDGKRWFWGDRIFYLADDSQYYQIESGTNVKSVNGKAGAVILSAKDVGAVEKTGDSDIGSLTLKTGSILDATITHRSGYMSIYPYSSSYGSSGNRCRLYYKEHNNNTPEEKNRGLVISSSDVDGTQYDLDIWLNGKKVYRQGFTPSPDEVGTYDKATIDQKDDNVKGMFSSYYNKNESDNLLSLKANQSDVVAALDNKADKSTTINGKSLATNVVITSEDVNALSKTGVAVNDNALGVQKSGTTIAFEVGTDKNPYVSVDFKYQALAFNKTDKAASFVGDLFVNGNKKVFHEGYLPSTTLLGAADSTSTATVAKLFDTSNSNRLKEVQIFSKEGRLFAISADGTKTQFYNDRTYRPTLADFGGLAVEHGNELNIPSTSTSFLIGYRQSGASAIADYHFMNGKAQASGYSNVRAADFLVGSEGYRVYSPLNPPTSISTFDNRDVTPSTALKGGASITLFKNSNIGVQTAYSDLLVLNSWADASAGKVNAIAAEKRAKALYHLQAEIDSNTWGNPDKIYTSANKPTGMELEIGRVWGDSDYSNGTLISTNIDATASTGASFTVDVIGKSYLETVDGSPIHFIAEGYLYNDGFVSTTGYVIGEPFTGVITFCKLDNGNLGIWFPRQKYWNNFGAIVTDTRYRGGIGFKNNCVTSVTDSAKPVSNRTIDVKLHRVYGEYTKGDVKFANKVVTGASFSIGRNTDIGARHLQFEIHQTGAMDISTSDGSNWYYPLSFDTNNNVLSNGQISAKDGIFIPHSKLIGINCDPRGVNGAGAAGIGWSMTEESSTGAFEWHRYNGGVWQNKVAHLSNDSNFWVLKNIESRGGNFYSWGDTRSHFWFMNPNTNKERGVIYALDDGIIRIRNNGSGVREHKFIGGSIELDGGNEVQGEDRGLIKGYVQGGDYTAWRNRAAGLQIDCHNSDALAYNVWKATDWGRRHIASMDVHWGDGGYAQLHVSDKNFLFKWDGKGYAPGGWVTGSDKNFKTDIKPLVDNTLKSSTSWLDKICSLTPSTFRYKNSEHHQMGFIAQDVQEHIPNAVIVNKKDGNHLSGDDVEQDRLYLDPVAIIAAQNEAIKELREMVISLKDRIDLLEKP